MRISIKLFGSRYVLKISLPPDRHVKWLPALFWAKVGRPITLKENT